MKFRIPASLIGVFVLAGCVSPNQPGPDGILPIVPEQVVALAAPNQNLSAVRFGPDDTCYWYLHSGPVEETWLPLRSQEGNPICTQPAES